MKSGGGYLLDTCVISELIRAEPSPKVMEWIDGQEEQNLHLSVITLGEIEKGISKLAEGRKRMQLQSTKNPVKLNSISRRQSIDLSLPEQIHQISCQKILVLFVKSRIFAV